ncbi:MAG: hypothetical protein RL112_391 [Planctomycetota bacterium]|jgi:hypothetical protein
MRAQDGLRAPLALARVVAPRDEALVERLLERHATIAPRHPVLVADGADAGLLRLFEARDWRSIVVEPGQPGEAGSESPSSVDDQGRVRADLRRLPFEDDAFDLVVSRGLQRAWQDEHECAAVVRELVRVGRGLVVASYWDHEALPRRVPWPRSSPRRVAMPRALLRELFEDAGAAVVDWRHSFRFVSQQAWLVARKRAVVRRASTLRHAPAATTASGRVRLGPLGA